MYWLIEDIGQLKGFYNSGYKEAFIEVIPFNNFTHPSQNNVSLVYIRPYTRLKGLWYVLTIVNHLIRKKRI